MLIALIVLVVLDLVLTFVVFCGQRALWARLPEPVANPITVGEVASAKAIAAAVARMQGRGHEPPSRAQQ